MTKFVKLVGNYNTNNKDLLCKCQKIVCSIKKMNVAVNNIKVTHCKQTFLQIEFSFYFGNGFLVTATQRAHSFAG